MKSQTTRPPWSRSRSWRTISSAASRLVETALLSASRAPRLRPELTSIATIASVWSITSAPPDSQRDLAGVDQIDLPLDVECVEERNRLVVVADLGRPIFGETTERNVLSPLESRRDC